MVARSVLGLSPLRTAFLDDVSAAKAGRRRSGTRPRSQDWSRARVVMNRLHLDNIEDDRDDPDDDDGFYDDGDDEEADDEETDDEEDDEDDVETWQVSNGLRFP